MISASNHKYLEIINDTFVAMDWIFVFPQHSYVETLISKMVTFRGKAWEVIKFRYGLQGGVSMMRLVLS